MRIGLDGIVLRGRDAGTRTYFRQLAFALDALERADEYVLFAHPSLRADLLPRHPRFHFQPVSSPRLWPRVLVQQSYRGWSAQGTLDLLHSPVWVVPPRYSGRTVTTVFDLVFHLHPQMCRATGRLWWRLFGPRGIARADRVIALSENTRRDLVTHLHVPEDKIRVIYPCVSEAFHPTVRSESLADRYRLPERYLLFVGTLEPRKNLPLLLRAYALARRIEPFDHALVLAGAEGWQFGEVYQTVRELGLEDRVHFLGYVPDEDLPELYAGADLFAYLSLYEGFGLPVLEAMACGVPVLAARAASLPEVVGAAGVLVPPDKIETVARAMARLLAAPDERRDLSERGLARAAEFSPERLAQETQRVYEEVARPCASA